MFSPPKPQRTSARIRQLATAYFTSTLDESSGDGLRPIIAPIASPGFERRTVDEDIERFGLLLEEIDLWERNLLLGSLGPPRNDNNNGDDPYPPSCLLVTVPTAASDLDIRSRPMPKMELPPVFLTRPLNLNLDGTPRLLTTRNHTPDSGPHAEYWTKADGEEIERPFVTGTMHHQAGDLR